MFAVYDYLQRGLKKDAVLYWIRDIGDGGGDVFGGL